MTPVSRDIFDSCIKIHKKLEPGLFETVFSSLADGFHRFANGEEANGM